MTPVPAIVDVERDRRVFGNDATCEKGVCGEKIFKEHRTQSHNYFIVIH